MTRYLIALLAGLVFFGCSEDSQQLIAPEETTDGLLVADPTEMGFDTNLLLDMEQANIDGEFENVHSILISKESKLVYEVYFEGKPIFGAGRFWNKDIIHNLHSVTKSINSALVGIAIDQYGLSLDDKLKDIFPELSEEVWEGEKSEITIEDLLTMSSGLQWDEWTFSYNDPRNDHSKMNEAQNWVHYVLRRPLDKVPGSTFVYNSGLSITLGEIVDRVSGSNVERFATKYLFEPLGITTFRWNKSPIGIFQTGGGLSLRPRDMLKFGLLFLNKGMWNGEQVISEDWAMTSTSQQGPNQGYGYQWWISSYNAFGSSYDAYLAAGRGGQYIIVIPTLDLVVVFTAGNDNLLATQQPRDMMQQFILPSLIQ